MYVHNLNGKGHQNENITKNCESVLISGWKEETIWNKTGRLAKTLWKSNVYLKRKKEISNQSIKPTTNTTAQLITIQNRVNLNGWMWFLLKLQSFVHTYRGDIIPFRYNFLFSAYPAEIHFLQFTWPRSYLLYKEYYNICFTNTPFVAIVYTTESETHTYIWVNTHTF